MLLTACETALSHLSTIDTCVREGVMGGGGGGGLGGPGAKQLKYASASQQV